MEFSLIPARRRRLWRTTKRLLGSGLYHGAILQMSIMEAKLLACHLCKQYLRKLDIGEFWTLFGVLILLILLFNSFFFEGARLGIRGYIRRRSQNLIPYQNLTRNRVPKLTRSGRVYGYWQ